MTMTKLTMIMNYYRICDDDDNDKDINNNNNPQ